MAAPMVRVKETSLPKSLDERDDYGTDDAIPASHCKSRRLR